VLLKIPSIIVTLGTMSIFRGLALVLSQAKPISSFPKQGTLFQLGADGLFGIPAGVMVMLLVCGAAHVALHHLPFGWRLQAIGSSPRAARFSGIAIARSPGSRGSRRSRSSKRPTRTWASGPSCW
jgi:ribose transport system permease protein